MSMTLATRPENDMALAQAYEQRGDLAQAEAIYRRLLQQSPNHHSAWHALGLLAFQAANLPLAVRCLEAAIAIDGKVAIYLRNIGELYRRQGQFDRAIRAGRRAVRLAPGDLDAHYNLGLAYTDAGDYPHAIVSYRKALKIDQRHNLSWNNLGSTLEKKGDKTAALAAYEQAIAIDPGHAEAQNNAGALCFEAGRLEEARAHFIAAIAARPDFVEAHYNLSSLKSYTPDDPHLALLEQLYARRNQLSEHARIRYGFALGKALDDIGEYDRAFAAYEEGNRIQHAGLPMDESRADRLMRAIMTVFDADFFAERRHWQGAVDASRTPIFIVGMPRSGTSLLEQILSSHASVHGAGELTELSESVGAATGAGGDRSFTEGVRLLSEAEMKRIGDDYLRRVWALSPESAYITDKMPANFFYLGLIHLALPQAKIIHAMRDPMDSCFSCYSRLFNETMEFAYDQGTLGRYYLRYITLMKHWHRVLPPGTILDLPYEDMVADTEGQARRVLAFIGLPWDENCLKFHENKRLVKTASVAQVRKPIYQSSVARWKHFARHLQPLLDIVRDHRPADGAEISACEVPPATAEEVHATGIALYRQNRFAEALACYDRALAIKPDFAAALNSRGFLLQDLDRMDEALTDFSRAVTLAPEMAMARLNLGMAQLKLGDFTSGWDNYEARWSGSAEANSGKLAAHVCPLPQWNGEADTAGLRLLVITEQGFGDTLQMARYLPLAARRFAKLGFACSLPTQRLMEWSFGEELITLTRLPATPDAWQSWDLQCPLMSLPRAFGTRLDSIPADTPYLRIPEKALAYWRERLEQAAPGRFRVGIAWAGRQGHQCDQRRSLRLEQLAPLFDNKRVTWVSLQKWAPQAMRPDIPQAIDWLDWTDELTDFADTAALVGNLDLIISIDSAMVHLAGALGRPIWMLDRFDNEWRWLHHRAHSPWYPSLRIFRQSEFGDWATPLADAADALAQLASSRPIRSRKSGKRASSSKANRQRVPSSAAPPASMTAETALHVAGQHQSAGRLMEAEQVLRQILQIQPRHAHALHLLGVVAYQAGNSEQGIGLIGQAMEIEPNVALFHSNLAEMRRQAGRLDEAIRHGERAVALDPSMASAVSNLGIAYYDAGDYARAERCHQTALALAPRLVQSLNNLGSIARARKDKRAAIDWYRKALASAPDYLEALSNLGAALVENEQYNDAVAPLERALQLQPAYPEALCNLGLARFKQDRPGDAAALLRRSLQLRPDYPEALIGLATVRHEQGELTAAFDLLQEAIAVAPDKQDAWTLLGTVCVERDAPDEAEAAYRRALDIDREATGALTGLGYLSMALGRTEEAEAILREALALDPDQLDARFHLVQARKVASRDENVAALEARLAGESDTKHLISLHYALGKAYDDLEEWDRAFPHFLAGARLKRAQLDYDAGLAAARTQRIIDVVDQRFIERHGHAGDPSDVPVFILGMPRSGTTLTEQILASHPAVHGAGELPDLMDLCQRQGAGGEWRTFPENLIDLDSQTLSAWGRDYVAGVRRRAQKAKRITDKMPINYLALGLIPLMLPRAKIIHVRRNPIDTCVSCFTRLFNRYQDATYDLTELGRHYVDYARLMNHWRAVLPSDSFLEVQYEDIVADMAGQARRLVEFIGLPWDDACLAFHTTKRTVRTASIAQVRQPIYSSSIERWRHYQSHLGPLLDALGELAPR
ncbi:sulfotransferase [Paludibacterium purpuratum]|uniref:Tfp pilus assembly protein PilF n=1 Tax=Paludibacterium purpuratum TaxID=1144873 RepID=A0A4R7AXP8_9NEIS|nr:sulfotransferase [Paludibacterium purpuratum]TDR71086.1 Tfp pilus assembly protein PilF [Paludibacterium purpuratum]